MARAVRDLTLRGGKRLRAVLVLIGYLASNQHGSFDPALDAGVAFELLQTYLLVHDDWMDGDERRRGGPSVPAMLREHHGSTRLGDAAAVLAGDFAAALSLDVLSRLDAPPERLIQALNLFAEMAFVLDHYPAVPAAAVVAMATLGGAGALGQERSFGSIDPGKQADLLVVSVPASLAHHQLYETIIHQGTKGAWQWLPHPATGCAWAKSAI